jgi:hypothetical protein
LAFEVACFLCRRRKDRAVLYGEARFYRKMPAMPTRRKFTAQPRPSSGESTSARLFPAACRSARTAASAEREKRSDPGPSGPPPAAFIRDVTHDVRDRAVARIIEEAKTVGTEMLYVRDSAEAMEHARRLSLV